MGSGAGDGCGLPASADDPRSDRLRDDGVGLQLRRVPGAEAARLDLCTHMQSLRHVPAMKSRWGLGGILALHCCLLCRWWCLFGGVAKGAAEAAGGLDCLAVERPHGAAHRHHYGRVLAGAGGLVVVLAGDAAGCR